MIHEVMVLDHSGPELAMILYGNAAQAGALRRARGGRAGAARAGSPPGVAGLVLLGGLVLVAVAVGMVEASMARLRMNRVPQFLVAAGALAVVGVILLLR